MLLVTHYSFAARLAAQDAQCSGWKRRFKKSEDESSTTCSDGFERLHSMAIARRHTFSDLTRSLCIIFYNEIWQMLLVTHYSFTARLAVQGAQCSGWKRHFKKSEDESIAPHAAMASKDYIRWM